MKDPSGEILTAFVTALSAITYNSKAWHVYKEKPPRGNRNYIYLAELTTSQDNVKETPIIDCLMNIEVSVIKDKYCKTIANDLSNSIIQTLVGKTILLTNFEMNFSSSLNGTSLFKEVDNDANYIKIITLHFQTQQN